MEDIKANRNCLNQNSQNLQDYQNKTKDEFTYKIIGCAMRVQYQRSLAVAVPFPIPFLLPPPKS
jgi:hypothetical protein